MIKEFKEFISRGNVIDLAVGVIMGGAFGKIVTSVVNDLIMPFIGIALGGIDFSNITLTVRNAEIRFGSLIQSIIDFLIIAVCIFIIVKAINKLLPKKNAKKEEVKEVVKAKDENTILLEEIRDLLKEQKSPKTKEVKKTTKKSSKTETTEKEEK